MRGGLARDVLKHLRSLYRCGVTGHLSDEQLLDRFVARRDETGEEAFGELLQRHGPMVLRVCHRVLGDVHEAEDAFQATFFVLARKATSVVRRDKVVNWLYGVAVRTAKEARHRASRRRTRERRVSKPVRVSPSDDEFAHELRAILDEEIACLPARYRGALVLCELEGIPRPEAARRLGIPEGTLSSRLARAKAQLRDRLARRGVAVPAVTLSAVLIREAHPITLPVSLAESTVGAATSVAAGSSAAVVISASVASLTKGVLKAMLLAKLKGTLLGIGTLAAVISGAVVFAQSGVPGQEKSGPPDTDRTAAMERKLDRILDALDRLSRTALTPASTEGKPGEAGKSIGGPVPARTRVAYTDPVQVQDELPPSPTNPAQAPPSEGQRTVQPEPRGDASASRFEASVGAEPLEPLPQAARQTTPPQDLAPDREAPSGAGPQDPKVRDAFRGESSRTGGSKSQASPPQRSLADRLGNLEVQMQHVAEQVRRLERRLTSLEKLVGAPSDEGELTPKATRGLF